MCGQCGMGNKSAPEGVEEGNGTKQDWVTQKTFSATQQLGAQNKSSKGGAGTGPYSSPMVELRSKL